MPKKFEDATLPQESKENDWESLSRVEEKDGGFKVNSRYVRHEILKQLGEQMISMSETFKDKQTALNAEGTALHITDRVHVLIPLDKKYSLGINFSLFEIRDFDLNLPENLTKFIEGGFLEETGYEHEAGNKIGITIEGDDLTIKNNGAF